MASHMLFLVLCFSLVLATPDCYSLASDSVSKRWKSYNEPPGLDNFRVDWLTLKPGKNCAFYTFNDLYFNSFNQNVQGIYLNFLNSSTSA
jgi:hypothetical protein